MTFIAHSITVCDMKITARLKALLGDHAISQVTFADAIDIRRETVNRWLNEEQPFNPSLETVDRILAFARSLDSGITYEALFGEPRDFGQAIPPAVNE